MFRRLKSTPRVPKTKEAKADADRAPTRIDPALSMGLENTSEFQFSYPAPDEGAYHSLRQSSGGSDDAAAVPHAASEAAADDETTDRTRFDDILPGARRSKLARAAARLPKAVDGMVTVKRGEGRRMVVGRDICLSGEIKSCDSLAVEGRVEADLKECTNLEVLPSGVVKGNATVQRCEIAGIFEGNLTAEQYLLVRAGGRILGNVSYREIEVERGGHIAGQIDEIDAAEAEANAASEPSADDESRDYEKELEEERARLKALQASA